MLTFLRFGEQRYFSHTCEPCTGTHTHAGTHTRANTHTRTPQHDSTQVKCLWKKMQISSNAHFSGRRRNTFKHTSKKCTSFDTLTRAQTQNARLIQPTSFLESHFVGNFRPTVTLIRDAKRRYLSSTCFSSGPPVPHHIQAHILQA